MNEDEETVTGLKAILKTMVSNGKFGGCHTQVKTVMHRIKNTSGPTHKRVDKFMKKSQWFKLKKSDGEWHCSLYSDKKPLIDEFIFSDMPKAIEILKKYE